jgi:hypothetical protein
MASRSNLGGQGGVEVKISGDTSPLIQDVAEAKVEVEKLADGTSKLATETTSAGKAAKDAFGEGGQTQGGLKGLNKTLGDTVGQVQGLIGKFAIVTGVATGMFALGRAIREGVISALESGTEKAAKFAESLDLTKKAESVKNISDEINKLSGELTAQENNSLDRAVGFFTGSNPEKLREEITRLNKLAQSLRESNNAERERIERDAEKKAQADRLAEWERENDARIAAASIAANEKRDKDIEAEIQAHDKRMELLAEYRNKAEEAANATRQAWVNAFTQIRTASNEVFGSNRAMGDVGTLSALTSMNTRSGASNRITFDGGN